MSLVDLGKRLLEAAKHGDTDDVRTLMSNGAPFTTDWLGTSPLHFAAHEGHIQTAEVLLRAGISRDARTKVDRTPLHVASQEGHVEIVELLLMHSADVDAKDMLKMTPLHWATEKGRYEVADVLIKQGADINCENKFDKTPLDIAIANGRTDLIQLLQLAQVSRFQSESVAELHTQVSGITEGESVTIETSESVIPETEETLLPLSSMCTSSKDINRDILPVTIVQNASTATLTRGSDQNSTSVLATLAALAEASGPINTQNVNTSDAVNWLESQGVTMITTPDGGIITSAVESGQTITLTEAGKIALNLIKNQGLTEAEDTGSIGVDNAMETVVETGTQNVITIVANNANSEIPAVSSSPVMLTIATEPPTDGSGDVQSGLIETVDVQADITKIKTEVEEDRETPEDIGWLQEKAEEEIHQEDLRKQLEEVQKQAEAYKQQLKKKEEEAENYKKQLNEITRGDDSQSSH